MYETLLSNNRGLIIWAARRYAAACHVDRATDVDDLMQAAFLGLVKASETYDASKGSWINWALYYIRQEIFEALSLRGGRRAHTGAISLDEPLGDDSDDTRLDAIIDDSLMLAEDIAALNESRRLVQEAVSSLANEQEREVVQRWKLNGESARQVGEAIGVNQKRIYSIWNAARHRLARDRRMRSAAWLNDCAPYYRHVGVQQFNRTWTSATEYAALWRIDHMRGKQHGEQEEP